MFKPALILLKSYFGPRGNSNKKRQLLWSKGERKFDSTEWTSVWKSLPKQAIIKQIEKYKL